MPIDDGSGCRAAPAAAACSPGREVRVATIIYREGTVAQAAAGSKHPVRVGAWMNRRSRFPRLRLPPLLRSWQIACAIRKPGPFGPGYTPQPLARRDPAAACGCYRRRMAPNRLRTAGYSVLYRWRCRTYRLRLPSCRIHRMRRTACLDRGMPRRSGVRRHVCALDGCAASLECAGLTALWMDAQRLWITATHQVIVQLSNRILPGALRAHPERRRAAALQTRPVPSARLSDSPTGSCRVSVSVNRNPATSCQVSRRPSGGRALLPAECHVARPADGRYFLLRVTAPVRRTGATAGATFPLAAPAG